MWLYQTMPAHLPQRIVGKGASTGNDSSNQHLTSSGKSAGAWSLLPLPFGGWWGLGMPPLAAQTRHALLGPPNPSSSSTDPCSSKSGGAHKRLRVEEPEERNSNAEQDDIHNLPNEAEALELVEFDPTVTPKNTWNPPKPIVSFYEKHFNRALSGDKRECIMKDFPKPDCGVLMAPKLDEQVKEHLKMKGKDSQFRVEKSLYKLQEQMLDVAGVE